MNLWSLLLNRLFHGDLSYNFIFLFSSSGIHLLGVGVFYKGPDAYLTTILLSQSPQLVILCISFQFAEHPLCARNCEKRYSWGCYHPILGIDVDMIQRKMIFMLRWGFRQWSTCLGLLGRMGTFHGDMKLRLETSVDLGRGKSREPKGCMSKIKRTLNCWAIKSGWVGSSVTLP